MKKFTTILLVMLLLVCCLGVFAACNDNEDDVDQNVDQNVEQDADGNGNGNGGNGASASPIVYSYQDDDSSYTLTVSSDWTSGKYEAVEKNGFYTLNMTVNGTLRFEDGLYYVTATDCQI